jgi:hypothetical protein
MAAALTAGGSARAADTLLPYSEAARAELAAAAEGRGRFEAPGPVAAHTVAVTVPDAFRDVATRPMTAPWTELLLASFVKHKTSPNRAARGLGLVHVGLHDAIVLSDQLCRQRPASAAGERWRQCASHHPESVVAAAAARLLRYLFVAEEGSFDRLAVELARRAVREGRATEAATQAGLALGARVGERMVEYAESDGTARGWNGARLEWYGEGRYYGPGSWEPTPPYFYYPPEEPFAPTWKTWLMESPAQFRPTPPRYGSERYLRDLLEVRDVLASGVADHLRIAKFWADGRGTVTPPGHWNQVALRLVAEDGRRDSLEVARIFARLGQALADAFIAAWDCKYAHWTARPVTAARRLLGVEIEPPILTPAFPSYVSGHAAFSGAAAAVLSRYFPEQKDALTRMADEAALSRLYAGIHFRFDNEDGLALGRKIGALAVAR